jgi:ATP-dependent protease ClpP protease subunit
MLIESKKRSQTEDENLEVLDISSEFLPYKIEKDTRRKLTINLDEPINTAKYYRLVCDEIDTLSEGDVICTKINSPGGYIDGAISLMNAIKSSPATHECILVGSASSAASFFPMIADRVVIGEYSSMLIHTISFGSSGKGSDVYSAVEFTKVENEKLLRKIYNNFLTPDELKDVLLGKELFLNQEDIERKFKNKSAKLRTNSETKIPQKNTSEPKNRPKVKSKI